MIDERTQRIALRSVFIAGCRDGRQGRLWVYSRRWASISHVSSRPDVRTIRARFQRVLA